MLNVTPSIQNLVQLLDLLMLTDVEGTFVSEKPLMACCLCYMTDATLHQASVLTALLFVAVMEISARSWRKIIRSFLLCFLKYCNIYNLN